MYGITALFVIEIFNEGDNTALVMKDFLSLKTFSCIGENDFNACIKERLLSHSGEKNFVIKYGILEDLTVGLESYVKTVTTVRVALTAQSAS